MAGCEKCWADAFSRSIMRPEKTQTEHYLDLLEERKGNPCTPKEQAGDYWDDERQCDIRFIK